MSKPDLDLARQQDSAGTLESLPSNASLSDILRVALVDVRITPEKISQLLDIQERVENRQAEREFNAAFARLLPRLPRLVKRGKIEMGTKGSIAFVTVEDMDAAIRPLYTAEGFSLSFLSDACPTGIVRIAMLSHKAGHSITSRMQLPPDKGPGRNDLQALGSSMSYADRYLTRGLFNLIAEGEDDDGNAQGYISPTQVEELKDLIMKSDANESALLATYGAKVLGDLHAVNFQPAKMLLNQKLRAKIAKEK